jgi:hypothetical protein
VFPLIPRFTLKCFDPFPYRQQIWPHWHWAAMWLLGRDSPDENGAGSGRLPPGLLGQTEPVRISGHHHL